MSTTVAERLGGYYHFDEDIVASVEEAMAHEPASYKEFLSENKIPEPSVYTPDTGPAIQLLDLKPHGNYDGSTARILHSPMGSGLTPNKIFRAATLFKADPSTRLIVIGNPGLFFRDGYNKIPLRSLLRVAKGDLGPVVESELRFLDKEAIDTTIQLGYSLGADLAAAASVASEGRVVKGVFVEPAAVSARGLGKLMKDFNSTGAGYTAMISKVDTPLLLETRKLSENLLTFMLSLTRLSNIAIANALAKDGFQSRVETALRKHAQMRAHLIWAENSEIALDEHMRTVAADLQGSFPDRFKSTVIPGQNHSMSDDLALHAALMLHGMRH